MKSRILTKMCAGTLVSVMGIAPVAGVAVMNAVPTMAVMSDPNGTITASGITESGVTVKAYQIVRGNYTGEGKLKGYSAVSGVTIADLENPTAAEITSIANNIQSGRLTGLNELEMTKGKDGKYASSSATPGLYVILASGASDTVYNPGIAAVNVTDANDVEGSIQGSNVDYTSYFNTGANAYLKSSTSSFDKKITSTNRENDYGATVEKGETVTFTLDSMHIPSFSADYTKPVYKIEDMLDSTLTYVDGSLKVKVGGTEVAAGDSTYTATAEGHKVNVAFSEAYLKGFADKSEAERAVEITYNAKLGNGTDGTTYNVNANDNFNTATLTYSNNPSDESKYKTVTKENHIYTFDIDGSLTGQSGGKTTHEILKGNEDSNYIKEDDNNTPVRESESGTDNKALAGAAFGLYSDEACKTELQNAVTTSDGRMHFSGLDEGTYYIREKSAPSGYTLTDQVYKVIIEATCNDDGTLASYTVKINDGSADHTTTYAISYKNHSAEAIGDSDVTETKASTLVKNTKLLNLPSTGARGTILFTVIGVTGMAVAVARKKKKEKSEEDK